MDRNWFGKSFIEVLAVRVFAFYSFSLLLPKLLASTTNRILGEDLGYYQFVSMLECTPELPYSAAGEVEPQVHCLGGRLGIYSQCD